MLLRRRQVAGDRASAPQCTKAAASSVHTVSCAGTIFLCTDAAGERMDPTSLQYRSRTPQRAQRIACIADRRDGGVSRQLSAALSYGTSRRQASRRPAFVTCETHHHPHRHRSHIGIPRCQHTAQPQTQRSAARHPMCVVYVHGAGRMCMY